MADNKKFIIEFETTADGRGATAVVKSMEEVTETAKKAGAAVAEVGDKADGAGKKGVDSFGKLGKGAMQAGAAFSGGFATGMVLAKAAGVDMTEMLSVGTEALKKFAGGLDYVINRGLKMLTGALSKVTFGSWKQAMVEATEGMDAELAVHAERRKHDFEKEQKEAKEKLDLLEKERQKQVELAQERVHQAEAEMALYGKSTKAIQHVADLKKKLATLEKKGIAELTAIQLEANKQIVDAAKEEVDRKTKLDLEYHKNVADLRKTETEDEKKAAEIRDKLAEQVEGVRAKFFTAQATAVDTELAHLKATNRLELADMIRLTKKKIDLTWQASKQDIEAINARAAAEQALEDETLQIKTESANHQVEMTVGVANAAIGAANAIFGPSKEAALAGVAVNAAAGSIAIWSKNGELWTSIAAEAILVLETAAAVANITAAKPPSGKQMEAPSFDDPVNDAVARRAGHQSAVDLVNHVNQGFVQGLSSGQAQRMNGNTTSATLPMAVSGGGGGGGGIVINMSGSGAQHEVVRSLRREMAKFDKNVETQVRGNRSKRIR